MALADLTDWMNENTSRTILWYLKRLAANDTLANDTHQAGPYIPKEVLFEVFPSINSQTEKNPDKWFDLAIDSHGDARQVRAVYYNNKFTEPNEPDPITGRKKSRRDEARLTNFGGEKSALLDPENTGALVVFAFRLRETTEGPTCRVWVCESAVEEDIVEERVGPVEPGQWKVWTPDEKEMSQFAPKVARTSCWLDESEIPPSWLDSFPTGAEIVHKTVEMRSDRGEPVDVRLMKRRACEYEIFRSVEHVFEMSAIKAGFESVEDFISRAQTILQRRKSRSGLSLELHTREILLEENFVEGRDFQHQAESESGKCPDFLFPNGESYSNPSFPAERLRLLAVKTTCKDRWRQVIDEADRIPVKHLLTLQEGLSENQFRQMSEAGIRLIVPTQLINSYSSQIRPNLQSLESFIGDLRLLNLGPA